MCPCHILTCFSNIFFHSIGVRLGEYDTSTEEDCIKLGPRWRCNPPVEDIGIENIVAHPEYRKSKHVNDIALIKLDRNVEFKSK